MCRLMVSRMHLAETDGAVWLFPASSGSATLVGVVHLTQPSRPCVSRGHALATVFARVIWSLASELTGLPSAVAVLFPCGAGRVLEIAGVAGEAWRLFDIGPTPTVEGGSMQSGEKRVRGRRAARPRAADRRRPTQLGPSSPPPVADQLIDFFHYCPPPPACLQGAADAKLLQWPRR